MKNRIILRCISAIALASASSALAGTGFVVKGSSGTQFIDTANISITNYVGQCPGSKTSSIDVTFLTDKAPIAPSRRVYIRNISPTVSNKPYPFADREYDRGTVSEGTVLYPGFFHDIRIMAVAEGKNTFDFLIKDDNGKKFVASGVFDLNVKFDRREVERNQICNWVQRCYKVPPPPHGRNPNPDADEGDLQSPAAETELESFLNQPVVLGNPIPFPPPPDREICEWKNECYCPN